VQVEDVALPDQVDAEAVVALFLEQAEPGAEVDPAGRDQRVDGPEHHPL
jgi:hypothetical protein